VKKFEIEHLTKRINEVVKCTNGTISTRLNNQKKGTGLTDNRKLELIRSGRATLLSDHDLYERGTRYGDSCAETVIKCFEYPTTEAQKEKIKFNEIIDKKIEALHTEVELEGKRLLDKALLGIIEAADIPDELYKLGEMAQLAK